MSIPESRTNSSPLLGARASNAGDVFHELWALRAALALLIPKTELKAVTVEGIAASEAGEYQYDGVDCGLFYGDASLEGASELEFIQLKYSTADPTTPWTIARLTANKAKKGRNNNNSVLHKLAETYHQARLKAAPSAQIAIKLVSNQPLDDTVNDAVRAILDGNTTSDAAARLIAGCGLSGSDLTDFLRALDFSQMGSGSRSALQDSVTLAVAEIIDGNADTQILMLQQRVRNLMLPGAEKEKITQGTVLSWFGVSSLAGLFPAPADLQSATNPIQRLPAEKLLDAVQQGHRLVCLHGPGGCGKTTTVMQLATLLPPGSVSVVFDCYGGGRYSYSNDRRHLPENAFLQIVNELAWTLETPFIIAKSSTNPAGIQTFLDRVSKASTILAAANSSAILAIIIDAADNAIAAAENSQPTSPCFVWEITGADLSRLPPNVHIIISSRTGRKTKLRLPRDTLEVICPEFTRDETAAFVRSRLPDVSEDWIDQFASLSSGVPRVQSYAFTKGAGSAQDVLEALRPSGKKLDTVLRELFQQAAAKSGDNELYSRCVATLALLPTPVPLAHLAGLCRSSEETAADFIADVQPSLRIEDGAVAIADEDVEDFLKEESSQRTPLTSEEICQYFSPKFRNDTYAAVHYCDFLARAGRAAEILPILECDLMPAGISDPIERREVQLRRLRLALGACRSTKNAVDALKVVLLCAEAAKDEDALRELLERETDLSVRFASASLLRLVLSDRDTYPKQGSVLAQDAARAAYAGDAVSARERLRAYGHWIERRREVERSSVREWDVAIDDIVALQETVAILDGAHACKASLFRWRPISNWINVAQLLIPRLIARNRSKIVAESYHEKIVRSPWSLLLAVPLAMSGEAVSNASLVEELSALRTSNVPDLRRTAFHHRDDDWRLSFLELIVTACEIAFSRGIDAAVIERALDLVLNHRTSPSSAIDRMEAAKIDIALRGWLLRRYLGGKDRKEDEFKEWLKDSNAPAPAPTRRRRATTSAPRESNRADEELSNTIKAIFSIYVSRLEVILEARAGEIVERPKAALAGLNHYSYQFEQDYWSAGFRTRAGYSLIRLMHIRGLSLAYLHEHAETIVTGRYPDAFAGNSVGLWKQLLLRRDMHGFIADEVTSRLERLRNLRAGSKSKAEALIKLSRLALNFNEMDAKALFENAVEIIQEIDREAMVQIEFIADLSVTEENFGAATSRSLAAKYAAFVTDVAIRLEGEGNFPWKKATRTLAKLAPGVALAAISQWQDENVASLHDTLPAFMINAASQSHDGLMIACAMIVLLRRAPVELFESLANLAKKAKPEIASNAFEMLASDCLLSISLKDRPAVGRSLSEVIPPELSTGPAMGVLKEMVAFCDTAPTETSQSARVAAETLIDFGDDANFATVDGIRAAIDTEKEKQRERYISLGSILSAARGQIVQPAQRIPYLEAISTFDGDSFDAYDRLSEILAVLEAWRGGPAVENWRQSRLPQIISQNLWVLSRLMREYPQRLPSFLDAAGADSQGRVDILLEGLESDAESFSSTILFSLASLIVPALLREQIRELTEWYIARLHAHVPADIQARYSVDDIPGDVDEALGRFLFAQMSDVDVRVRWRASHCVRRLVAEFGSKPLLSLFGAYDRTRESSFRLPGAPFYWLAARLWSTITAARLAAEEPREASAISEKLCAIAVDRKLPHYLIKSNAKQALDLLVKARALSLTRAKLGSLNDVNRPKKKAVNTKRRGYRELEQSGRRRGRFNFSSLDTIPYWYSPLYRHFASLTSEKFYSTLERWLIDKWKVDPEASHWAKEARQARFEGRDRYWAHNSHGSMPVIERYGTYLEWHVMFCGLGEWLETEPLAVPEWSSDRLSYWAKSWNVTEPPTWLADRRDFAPLETDFVFEEGGQDKPWLKRIPKRKYLAAVLGANQTPDIIIEGSWTISRPKRETEVRVSSALVNPGAALALARTMQSASDYTFNLPYEREDDDVRLDKPPFELRPWVKSTDREIQFDRDDPLRNDVGPLPYLPANWLLKKYRLKPEGAPISKWSRPAGKVWFHDHAWSDFDERDFDSYYSRRETGTHGHRLKIDRGALLTILADEGLDLIVKVRIDHRLENEYGRSTQWDDKDKRHTVHKVFVFRKDGTIEGESGHLETWLGVGERVRARRGA